MAGNSELLKKIDPYNYYNQFISEGVYPDGRETVQFRSLCLEQCVDTKVYGSSYVQQGGASVSCTVNVSVAPYSDEPSILYDLKALECVNKELLDEANGFLARIIKQGIMIDINQLKVEKKQNSFDLRFTLHLEIVVISADGFLTGAVLFAVQAAIMSTRLPKVEYFGHAILEADSFDFDDIPLQFDITKLRLIPWDEFEEKKYLLLKDFLVNISFLLYSGFGSKQTEEVKLLCDPSSELRALIPNRCELTIGKNERIYSITINSNEPLADSVLTEVMRIAKRRYIAILNAVERSQKQLRQQQKK